MSDDLRVIGRRSDRGPEAAVVPERMLAGAIDFAILACIAWLLTLPASTLVYQHTLWPDIALITTAIFAYFIGFEWLFQATPGKLLGGLRVRTTDGGRPGLLRVVVRNALRVVDVLPSFYLVGMLTIRSTSNAQRIGDVAANTMVVKDCGAVNAKSSTDFVVVAFAGFVGLLCLWFTLSSVLEDAFLGASFAAVFFTPFAFTALLLILLGDKHARYFGLALVVCGIATIAAGVGWRQRYVVAGDYRVEIRARLEQDLPIGAQEGDARAYLRGRGLDAIGPTAATSDDVRYYQGEGFLHVGERHILVAFADALEPPWYCNDGMLIAALIFENDTLSEIRYQDSLTSCL